MYEVFMHQIWFLYKHSISMYERLMYDVCVFLNISKYELMAVCLFSLQFLMYM